ncbi:hypothetical protein AAG570_002770 [Ranatra chinensis]|uniref:Pre-mRNA-splicing factor SLU7 n=1 Tax=Ranatra chinensis TaxID=642074 RepID=A0ABD0Y5Y7_9HEMI
MATTTNIPVSKILRTRTEDDDEPKKKSREDWRKAKELEEARKAGTAPAAVDEEGKDINPHIPQYISSAPWYFDASGPTLKHQRIQVENVKEYSRIDEWYKRGVDTSKFVTKYRRGACENCGALTHKKKDCMDRPRKVGAKYSGASIAPDEFVQPDLRRDYDGKRDRWAGYDPGQHKAVIEQYAQIEEAKRQLRSEKLRAGATTDDKAAEVKESDDEEEEDDDKYVDEVDMPGTKVDSKQRITVRNLRIREDTAKYLRNLDPNSAYYDPKTRSMRDNPYGNNLTEEVDYAGENFVRFTGDTTNHARAQVFAWEAYEKGVDVHPLGEPTKLQLLQQDYENKKQQFKEKGREAILEKYGGSEHLDVAPKELLLAQTEHYAEYTRYGTLVKGQEKSIVRSKYEEDVFTNNHSSVWGSYWHNGNWGYRCCHSFIKGSYCTGEAGRAASGLVQEVAVQGGAAMKGPTQLVSTASQHVCDQSPLPSPSSTSGECSSSEVITNYNLIELLIAFLFKEEEKAKLERKKKKKNKKKMRKEKKKQKKKEEKTEEEKLKEALKKEDEQRREAERLLNMDERKRPYNSMVEVHKPTDIEMEAYYMKKRRDEDPMAQFT